MRILFSTFREGDADKLTLAMRWLPYDKIILISTESLSSSVAFNSIKRLEEMAGHEVEVEEVDDEDFLHLVEQISGVLEGRSIDRASNTRNTIVLNISGGSKLLGDAALFAAFRLGIETYHCENKVTKLPVIKGATPRDRFTSMQLDMISKIGASPKVYEDLLVNMEPLSKQGTDRLIRELKKQQVLASELKAGRILVFLTESGREVLKATQLA